MSENRTPRCKNMMLTQQVQHLPDGIENVKDLAALIDKKLNPKEYAVILHDQDTGEDGQPAEPHIHAMICFENACHITSIAKKLGIEPQYIAKWDGKAANGYAYLLHATDKAKREGKHPYEASDVLASFDFAERMTQFHHEIIQSRAGHGADNVKTMLDALYIGAISKDELEKQLSGSQYAKYHRQIEEVDAKRLLNEAEKWRAEMREKGASIEVIWITGPAGTGKTSLAKAYAEKRGQPYFITGSSRDIFQGYNGEHTLIIDELRPKMLTYSDLLRITDPHGIENQVMLPCRYADKALACDLVIITTPFTPSLFYYRQFGTNKKSEHREDCADGMDQLIRRIGVTIEMTGHRIEISEYNPCGDMYVVIPGTARPNPYSGLARPAPPNNRVALFNSLFE